MLALNSTTSQPQAAQVELTSASISKRWFQQISQRISEFANHRGYRSSPIIHIEYLRSLPRESFGRAWAAFLDTHNRVPTTTGTRRSQLQDGVHILTGYGTDPIGKAEVRAFLLGTRFRWINRTLAIALLHPIVRHIRDMERDRENRPIVITSKSLSQRLLEAYWRGRQSVFKLNTWQPEMLWDLPLGIVRQWFRV